MEQVKGLLRAQRYHDDEIDEAPRAALSVTRCALLPLALAAPMMRHPVA